METAVRLVDGIPLWPPTIAEPQARDAAAGSLALHDPRGEARAAQYARSLTRRKDVDPAWWSVDPPPLALRSSPNTSCVWKPMLEAEAGATNLEHYKLWNLGLVLQEWQYFSRFPGLVYVYERADRSSHPRYRFVPSSVTPAGLVTNERGFRGAPIAPQKPPDTVRIAFLGASTTVDSHVYPFSYPELIQPWLNLWAAKRGFPVKFETINAGREGVSSPDIAPIAVEEVIPLQPDLFVYYEGANQFLLGSVFQLDAIPPKPTVRSAYQQMLSSRPWVQSVEKVSALARRLEALSDRLVGNRLREPPKPTPLFSWPAGVDENHPDPSSPDLPVQLPQIFSDLDVIRGAAAKSGAVLVPSTFVWLAWDGMELDPVRHRSIFSYLNSSFWPYRYADIRRMADFENRAFRAYAAAHDLPLLDLAGRYPLDPDFFIDAVHMTYAGVRLKAWLAFLELLPILEERLAKGALPRADLGDATDQPGPPSVREGVLRIEDAAGPARTLAVVDLAWLDKTLPDAVLTVGSPSTLVTSARGYTYAFQGSLPAEAKAAGGLLRLRARLRVLRGAIGVGVTDEKGEWLSVNIVQQTSDAGVQTIDLLIPAQSRSHINQLVLTNGANDGEASRAEIESIVLEELPVVIRPLPERECAA